jgi:hypothetical protein
MGETNGDHSNRIHRPRNVGRTETVLEVNMIPENCQKKECLYYRDEGHIRYCKHDEYDTEKNECPGWVALSDFGRVYDPERHERERE